MVIIILVVMNIIKIVTIVFTASCNSNHHCVLIGHPLTFLMRISCSYELLNMNNPDTSLPNGIDDTDAKAKILEHRHSWRMIRDMPISE